MALTPKFTNGQLTAELERRMAIIEQAFLSGLVRVGEQFITDARENGTYKDRTGNLRSSVGYVVLKNGQQWQGGGFINTGAIFKGNGEVRKKYHSKYGEKAVSDGANQGREYIKTIAAKYPTGYVLIVVAGMDYAAAVESKGQDVLSGSAPQAVAALRKTLERVSRKKVAMR